jgi:dihydropteroate synthase
LISQVINLSNENAFNLYQKNYGLKIQNHQSIYGIEVREIPDEIITSGIDTESKNIYVTSTCLLLIGSFQEIAETISTSVKNDKIKFKLKSALDNYQLNENKVYEFGGRNFIFNQAYVMGVINITPDSFSDGGKYFNKENAVNIAIKMIEEGVDIIDVGGESTRPGSDSISEDEELRRVIPVIDSIVGMKPFAIISIDTTKSKVAQEALDSGASIVNDISGGRFDKNIFKVVQDFNAGMVIMHSKDKPKTMQESPFYNEVVSEVFDYLATQTRTAEEAGINKIIIDPGIGFGKRNEDNLNLIERLEDFKSLGFPILIGLSRKSFIGNILNLPVEERDDVTNVLNSISLGNGARIIRTHNFKQGIQTCKIFNCLKSNQCLNYSK